jgi:V/A-type H+-transporting ATPase subunit K
MNDMKRCCGLAWVFAVLLTLVVCCSVRLFAAEDGGGNAAGGERSGQAELATAGIPVSHDALYYAIALTMGMACLAAGYAVGKVGAAAMGVISEKPELVGRVLIFVGLAEGIAIYGLIISIMLMRKL